MNRDKVINALKAISQSVDKGNTAEEIVRLYDIGYETMAEEEREAYTQGALAILSDVGCKPIHSFKHRRKFAKLINK